MTETRPDPEHDAVCASQARHLLGVAPPGTGKTFLSIRLAGQLAQDLPGSSQVLLLTFSTQARTQLEREAARQLTPSMRNRIEITNYHRLFWQGVRAYRRALGLPLRLDIGSSKRRQAALEQIDRTLVRQLARNAGLIESLAEHAFPQFRDTRTPDEEVLGRLLAVVKTEQQEGRLAFDDLGALFWTLLERFPAVDQAYRERYPVVIADEHQDASALQDAIVRRFGSDRLIVFADPMQLIHGFRGASPERLGLHRTECDASFSLNTPHRWHGSDALAVWLLAVRSRLQGTATTAETPPEVQFRYTRTDHGFNAVKPAIKFAVSRAFADGARTVAVLAHTNDRVAEIRSYLSREGFYPRQIGGEFEDARLDIEQLPLLADSQSVALHCLRRIEALVPTLPRGIANQVRGRLGTDAVDFRRAGEEASQILRALDVVYSEGAKRYFGSVVVALDACTANGHHSPRVEAVRALRMTAEAFGGNPADLDAVLELYSENVVASTYIAPRLDRGLFVMTAHQSKGKEFGAVVLSEVSERYWPDNADTRCLFYVALTRATSRWSVIAPDRDASPLLQHLTG